MPKTKDKKTPDTISRSDEKAPNEVRFYFVKSNQFRVIHVDGVHGGINPNGMLQVAVFTERSPIPQETVHSVRDNNLGEEIIAKRVGKRGIVREVETELIFTLDEAVSFRDWLNDKISDLSDLRKTRKS